MSIRTGRFSSTCNKHITPRADSFFDHCTSLDHLLPPNLSTLKTKTLKSENSLKISRKLRQKLCIPIQSSVKNDLSPKSKE